jgi:hypothetical protein
LGGDSAFFSYSFSRLQKLANRLGKGHGGGIGLFPSFLKNTHFHGTGLQNRVTKVLSPGLDFFCAVGGFFFAFKAPPWASLFLGR